MNAHHWLPYFSCVTATNLLSMQVVCGSRLYYKRINDCLQIVTQKPFQIFLMCLSPVAIFWVRRSRGRADTYTGGFCPKPIRLLSYNWVFYHHCLGILRLSCRAVHLHLNQSDSICTPCCVVFHFLHMLIITCWYSASALTFQFLSTCFHRRLVL